MSRATNIWFVVTTFPDEVAAFTVKHEMLSWLEKHGGDLTGKRVFRVPDNPRRYAATPITEFDPVELLKEAAL